MNRFHIALAAALLAAPAMPARAAEPVMVRCGREYQTAKSAGTLGGLDWTAYRAACADRLKAAPAAASAPATAAASAPATAAAGVTPPAAAVPAPIGAASPPAAPATPPAPGMAAMHARQKVCGAEWTSGKATLVAQTPGLTWPRYWSQCNTRLKAAGR